MRFIILFFQKETDWIERSLVRKVVAWKHAQSEKGVFITGSPLKPDGFTTTLVPNGDGSHEKIEGPLNELEKSLFSFELVNAESMEAAVAIALSHPGAEDPAFSIEVREVWDTVDLDLGS